MPEMPEPFPPSRRAIFLDRDGVINRVVLRSGRPYPPESLEEFQFLPGVIEAVDILREAGFLLVVVTNQPDVATGNQQREVVEAMHKHIYDRLRVDGIKVCYHTDEDLCPCRKPKPGMLLEAAEEQHIDLNRSFMVGDRWRDIEAGRAAGCTTVLIASKYNERQPEKPDLVANSLREATKVILEDIV